MAAKFDFIVLDGITYNIGVYANVKEAADFLDKYAERVESGKVLRELIGVYFNYSSIMFEPQTDANYDEYERLWDKLTEPEEFHDVKIANFQFKAYFHSVSRVIYTYNKNTGKAYRKEMTVSFTAEKPARS